MHVADRFFFEELTQIVGKEESCRWLSLQKAPKTAGREKTPGRSIHSRSVVRAVRKCDSGKYQSRTEDDQRSEDIDIPVDIRRRYARLVVGTEV